MLLQSKISDIINILNKSPDAELKIVQLGGVDDDDDNDWSAPGFDFDYLTMAANCRLKIWQRIVILF